MLARGAAGRHSLLVPSAQSDSLLLAVLVTGLLLALRADQRLSPLDAALLGIYAHGRAGDLAAAQTGEAGLIAGDLVRFIGPALRELET